MKALANKLSERLDWFIEKTIVVLFSILLFDVLFAVADRYVFKLQMIWTEELARYLMIWTMLLAVASATARRQHVFISFVIDAIPVKYRIIILGILDLITVGVFFYISWLGIDFYFEGEGLKTSIYGMSFKVPYASISVSFFLAGVQSLLNMIRDLGSLPMVKKDLINVNKGKVF